MSAIARLWFKWVNDETKPYAIEDVPTPWKEEVQALVDAEEKKENEENHKDTGRDGQDN